ncbi:iron reductase [Lentinula edodes]|uniref:Iron reductase n=1 Tax=Lentinula edodes TaxID=5353 RepID=A0A1Q3E1U3_LENED|nr:iron reductase [Lentinula edodes]
MVEIHPFTIASVADSPNAKERATGRTSFSIWLVTIWVLRIRKVSVIVEGPYGGLGNWMKGELFGYSSCSWRKWYQFFHLEGRRESRVKLIQLICQTVQDASSLVSMPPLLTTMIQGQHSSSHIISLCGKAISIPHVLLYHLVVRYSTFFQETNDMESVHAAVSNVGTQRKDEVGYSRDSYRNFYLVD